MSIAQNTGAPAIVAARGHAIGIAELLVEIGGRAHASALAMSMPERVGVVVGVARPWDGKTYISQWYGGKKDTRDGDAVAVEWSEFGAFLAYYSHQRVDKGMGRWFTPGLSKNGRCRDEDISEITQLSLDADDVGDWGAMRVMLEESGLAHIIQRSSSHTPEHPKWHLHVPLYLHWSGDKPEWRQIYRHCVGWFSAAAELTYDFNGPTPMYGFDKTTDRIGQPWFPATRRSDAALPAETICRPGLSLDLEAFLNTTGFDPNLQLVLQAPRGRKGKGAKTGPDIASAKEDGPLDVPDFLVALAFSAAGMLGPRVGEGKWSVVCPWQSAHTTGYSLDSSTVIFSPTKRGGPGWFHCRHGHCEGRTVRDVLGVLPAAALAAAMAAQRAAMMTGVSTGGGVR